MSPIASQSQMLLNSFPDDLYIFRDCFHLRRLETAFPAHLSLGALVYLDRMSTPVVVPACLCDEWSEKGTFASHSCLDIKNGLSELRPRDIPACTAWEVLQMQVMANMGWVPAQECVLCLDSLWWCRWGLQSALCSPAASLWLPCQRMLAQWVAFLNKVSLREV